MGRALKVAVPAAVCVVAGWLARDLLGNPIFVWVLLFAAAAGVIAAAVMTRDALSREDEGNAARYDADGNPVDPEPVPSRPWPQQPAGPTTARAGTEDDATVVVPAPAHP